MLIISRLYYKRSNYSSSFLNSPFPCMHLFIYLFTCFCLAQDFEEDMENWRGSIAAVNQCGENLVQEFSQYESSELKHNLAELNERWNNIVNRSVNFHLLNLQPQPRGSLLIKMGRR